MAGSKTTKKTLTKDLAPKAGTVKGGRLAANDNLTLVRNAKPKVKKDLPPKKSPKGGAKNKNR
jgi:hypothetical protein